MLSTLDENSCLQHLDVIIGRYVQRIEQLANIPSANQHNKAQLIQGLAFLLQIWKKKNLKFDTAREYLFTHKSDK